MLQSLASGFVNERMKALESDPAISRPMQLRMPLMETCTKKERKKERERERKKERKQSRDDNGERRLQYGQQIAITVKSVE